MEAQRMYFCIDMKTFYASVECAERGLNPFETGLAVADESHGKNALCLAVSPALKAIGVRNRCRLSEIPGTADYVVVPPRMQLYVNYAADIYAIYLNYFSPEDIHVYSIDEAFIDATDYLSLYRTDAIGLAKKLMDDIAGKLHIPSTAGVGTNMYLAKIALDITAKHTKEHIGYLDEELYRKTLWDHEPITDFWQIASGTSRRLEKCGIFTMRGIANAPEELLYRIFGINAELLIDHAWGRESCTIADIKNYRSKSRSVSFSQILPRDYTFDEARTVLSEMAVHGCHELMKRKVIAKKLLLYIGYSFGTAEAAHSSVTLSGATALLSVIQPALLRLYEQTASETVPIRRLAISFGSVCGESCEGFDFFTDWEKVEKEKARERAALEIKDRFGKNAVLRGTDFMPAATQRERNEMIGGHRAGYDDARGQS